MISCSNNYEADIASYMSHIGKKKGSNTEALEPLN